MGTKLKPGKLAAHPAVKKFQSDYAQAMASAKVSAAHTETEGWRSLYSAHRKDIDARVESLAERLKELSATIGKEGPTEESVKAIGECKKQADGICEQQAYFEADVLKPIREPVDDCAEVIAAARQHAAQAEQEASLLSDGLVESMAFAIESVAKVSWDEKRGQVIVAAVE